MVSNNEFAQGLAECLDKVCQGLTPGPLVEEEVSPLREIERFFWELEDSPATDEDLRFLNFFFNAFLEKFFFSFSGEIPPVASVERILQRFIDELKEAFGGIAQDLREARYADLYPYYKKMGLAFLNTVDALNRTL